ncbi:MAG: GrpB family protein [Anaerolineae bacterium]|nr:GrpB family protein [Anaerolineae bacterium]
MSEFNANESFDLSEYNPQWPQRFEQERVLLNAALGEDEVVDIQHIGSTSVPGLRAKPIIDILVAVETFAPVEEYGERLGPVGYQYFPHGDEGERLFFWKGIPRTHHLHIVEYATWEHQRHIIFRDYLRAHPDIARRYTQVKEELATAFKHDRPAYTRGKTAFIKAIMERALAEIIDPELRKLVAQAEQDTADDESDD